MSIKTHFKNIKWHFSKVRDEVENILFEEYHQLILFFFIGQILGISTAINNNNFLLIFFIILFIGFINLKSTKSLLILFLKIFSFGFAFGVFTTSFKIYKNTVEELDGEYVISGKIIDIKPKDENLILTIKVNLVNSIVNSKVDKVLAKVDFHLASKVMIGNDITALIKLKSLKSNKWFLSSGNFNLQRKINGISGMGFIKEVLEIKSENIGLMGLLYKLRKNIYDVLVEKMGENGHFIAALVLGETGRLNSNILNAARSTGVSHILCVSGLHLSIICFIFFKMTRFILNCFDCIALRVDVKKISAFIAIIASILFLFISGMQIASTRAWIMTTLGILGIFLEKPSLSIRIVFLTGTLMLTFNPEYLYHPSFQLSYLAVIGIIISPKISVLSKTMYFQAKSWIVKYFFNQNKPSPKIYEEDIYKQISWKQNIIQYCATNIYITSLVSLITMPIVIYYFYFFANYSLLANLIIVPITSFILMPFSIISIFSIGFGNLINVSLETYPFYFLNFFVDITVNIMQYISKLPFAIFFVGHISYQLMSFCILSFLIFAICESKIKYVFGFLFLICISLIFCHKRPNVIVTENLIVINEKVLEIHADKYRKYSFQRIAHWLGKNKFKYYKDLNDGLWYYKNIAIINREIQNCNLFKDYKIINVLDNKKCKTTDVNLKDLIENGYIFEY